MYLQNIFFSIILERNSLFIGLFFSLVYACQPGSSTKNQIESASDSLLIRTEVAYRAINDKIRQNPDNAALYLERALISIQENDLSSGLKDLNRAIYIDSTKSDFYFHRADLYFKQRQTRAAREDLEKAVAIDPKSEKAYLKLAELELVLEKYAQAIKYCNEVLKINVFNPKAYLMKGMSYKYAGDSANAISSFQTAVEQDDQLYEGYIQLGALLAYKKDPIALEYYNNALRLQPTNLEAIYHKSMFLQELKQFDKAIEGYDLMLSIDSINRNAQYNKGYLYLVYAQDPTKALLCFEKVLKNHPNDVDALYNAGFCFEKKKNVSQASSHYAKALDIKPDYELAAKGLSRVGKK